MKVKKEKVYAVYKGDMFIDLGTKEYLAKKLNINPKTILFYTRPTYLKRVQQRGTKKPIIVIKIEDD